MSEEKTLTELIYDEHCPGWDKTEGEELACAKSVEDRHDTLVSELSARMSEQLGTPYRVFIERNVIRRTWDVAAECRACRMLWVTGTDGDDIEESRVRIERCIVMTLGARKNDVKVCRCVDGLPLSECLRRFEWRQRDEGSEYMGLKYASDPAVFLTPAQKDAARLAWSAELKRKQQEVGETERRVVVVDDDRWEP